MALPRLYTTLAEWWPLFSPPEHYSEEAQLYYALLSEAIGRAPESLLELGSGCGPLAANLPAELAVTLVDYSPEMVAISRQQNPDRAHVCADMRSLSLGVTFDAVLLHDAVMYLTDRDSLRQAIAVMYAHCAPGGAVLLVPDSVADTFEEFATSGGWGSPSGRAMQMLEWHWDPDPEDDTIEVAFSLMLREADGTMHPEHEQHTMGLYSRALFWQLLEEAGFEPIAVEVTFDAPMGELFLARRPTG